MFFTGIQFENGVPYYIETGANDNQELGTNKLGGKSNRPATRRPAAPRPKPPATRRPATQRPRQTAATRRPATRAGKLSAAKSPTAKAQQLQLLTPNQGGILGIGTGGGFQPTGTRQYVDYSIPDFESSPVSNPMSPLSNPIYPSANPSKLGSLFDIASRVITGWSPNKTAQSSGGQSPTYQLPGAQPSGAGNSLYPVGNQNLDGAGANVGASLGSGFDGITQWVSQNLLIVLGIGGVVLLLLRSKK